jgi:uncharacterized protein YjbI with pentapeptide repeats
MPPPVLAQRYAGIIECTDASEADRNYSRFEESGRGPSRPSFYLYTSPSNDKVPLYRYFNREFADVFLTTSWSELAYGFASWDYLEVVGYAYDHPAPDTVRLYRWFNDATGRHAYTPMRSPRYLRSVDGWKLESHLIYIPKPRKESESDKKQPNQRCRVSKCRNLRLRPGLEYCLDHVDPSDVNALLNASIHVDHESKIIDLTEMSIRGFHWTSILSWIEGKISDPAGWLIDLSGAFVIGDLRLDLPKDVSLDLSSARISGDFELRDCVLSNLSLAGSAINGSLTLRKTVVRGTAFADRMQVRGVLRVDELTAADIHVHFDKTSATRVQISNSNFDVLSFGSCELLRLLITNTTITTLVCTRLTVAQNLALRQCSINYAGFTQASVALHLNLEFNKFDGVVDLSKASSGEAIHLAESRYDGTLVINEVRTPWLDMHSSNFRGRIAASDMQITEVLDLRNSEMLKPVLIVTSPRAAVLDDAVFHREAALRLSGTVVSAVRTRFDSRSRIGGSSEPLKLINLADTDLSGLQLDEVDLTFCSFARSLNPEMLQFVGGGSFATVPRHLEHTPWYRWRAARKVIWEEVLMRADLNTPGWSDWRDKLRAEIGVQSKPGFGWALEVPELSLTTQVTLRQLGTIYRDLRRSQEQNDEEVESNEFYYSEMTARRQNARGWKRVVFVLYWILGGYGVRPSRPLAAFILISGLLATGFVQLHLLINSSTASAAHVGYTAALDHLLLTSTTVIGASVFQPRDFVGLLLDLLARLLLPTLLALMFFAIRANIKRGR